MASASDITTVRGNTNEPDDVAPYTDDYVSGLIDANGIAGASAAIWEQKAASLSEMVDVTEAGASHKFSDLFKSASAMASYWRGQEDELAEALSGRVRVKKIERS